MSSFAFLYFQNLYFNTLTVLDYSFIRKFVQGNLSIAILFVITIISILRFMKVGKYLYIMSVLVTFALSVLNLNIEFSKFNLVLIFFYLIIAFYLYQFYLYDIAEAYYIPRFGKNDLFSTGLATIQTKVVKDGNKCLEGVLTNWSEEGCFIKGEVTSKLKGLVDLELTFENRVVCCQGVIVSRLSNDNGIGVKISANELKDDQDKKTLGWKDFYGIIDEMGYKPELLT